MLIHILRSALQNVLIKIRFRGIKKDPPLSIYLENERSFTFLLFCWMMKILLCLWCVSEAAVQYHRHVYPIRICLFVHFPVTLVEPEKPLKMPEVERFYKSVRCSATIVSIWNVEGNISTQQIFFTSYPLACKTSRSLARLVGLQEI